MELNSKDYKITKTKNYMKKNSLFFFFNGITRNSEDWILLEQNLKSIGFNYYKIFNKTTKKSVNNSIFRAIKPVINSITFLIKPTNTKLSKQVLVNSFEPLFFYMLAMKINNKIYQTAQLKYNYSISYKNNKIFLFQFGVANLKQKSK